MSDTLRTRKPTGKPPWPIILIAGAEKTGKSYAAAAASASPLIGRTLWIGIGEDDPDEYGAIPGARFEIVEHDGSYRGIIGAVDAACAQASEPGRPNMIVIDSATRLWDLLIDDAQNTANRRADVKAKKYNQPIPSDDAQITMDLWNNAKKRWANVVLLLQAHDGPALITSRFARVVVVENGKPSLNKAGQAISEWKVKAEKSLPYDVGAVVEMPERGVAYLTKVRSLYLKSEAGERRRYDDFTVERLWRDLGVTDPKGTSTRQHAAVQPNNPNADLLTEIGAYADAAGIDRRTIAAEWAAEHDGEPLRQASDTDALAALRDSLEAAAAARHTSWPEPAAVPA